MTQSLVVSVSPGELWAALCEDGRPVELTVMRETSAPRPGDIVLGRVLALKPELPAALVEIGLDRPAFLSAEDTAPRSLAGLTEGANVIVQVTKEARGGKAVNVTLRPRLDGEFLALVPGGTTELAARGLDAAVRQRLDAAVHVLAAPGEGFRARANAAKLNAATDADLAADVTRLRTRWQAIETARQRAKPPARLEPAEPLAVSLLRSLASLPERIVIDDRAAFAAARSFLLRRAGDAARLALYADAEPLFEAEGIADRVEAALGARVLLPGGASLSIERTRAAILIDVDSGGAQAMAANLAAAGEAARQIRLRNLSGAIVIDFIAIKDHAQRSRILTTLARGTEGDPAAPEIFGWTRAGHVELVRRRRAQALDELLCEPVPPPRKTALTVALEALRALARTRSPRPPALRLAPDVAAALTDGAARPARERLEAQLGRPITVTADGTLARESFDVGAA